MRPKPEPPTFDSLIAALSAPRPIDAPNGLSTADIAKMLPWGSGKIRSELRNLMVQGKLETHQELRAGIDGKPHRTPVYSIKGKRV